MLCIFTEYYFCYMGRHSSGMDMMTTLSVMLYTVVGNLKRTGRARMSAWEFNVRMWTGLVYVRLLCNLLNFLVE
jgi:hypothetical protein